MRIQFLKLTLNLRLGNREQCITDLEREFISHEDPSNLC